MTTATVVHLRIYDDLSDMPQPTGPVGVEVPDEATDDQIIEALSREGDHSRPFAIERRNECINPGWALAYLPEGGSR
jgi:hypothetical protein